VVERLKVGFRSSHTWLRTLEADLEPLNYGLNSAGRHAQDRWKTCGNGYAPAWAMLVMMMFDLKRLPFPFGNLSGKIGISVSVNWDEPKDVNNPDDVEAAERSQLMKTGWFCDPIFGNGDYPEVMKTQLAKVAKALGLDRSLLPEFSEEEKRYNRGKVLFIISQFDEMIKGLKVSWKPTVRERATP